MESPQHHADSSLLQVYVCRSMNAPEHDHLLFLRVYLIESDVRGD